MDRTLILASSSRYRRALLERLQLPFETMAPDIDESAHTGESPTALVARLAVAKAHAIAVQRPHSLVIGSDQVAVIQDRIIGKPGSHAAAVRQLREASGQKFVLYTGLALIDADSARTQSAVVPFTVKFRELSDEQIENYLQKDRPYDCAGSVKSESLGIALLERMDGEDPTALIGLPLIRLVTMLRNEGLAVI